MRAEASGLAALERSAKNMTYYLRPWDEVRGDQFDVWGTSTWYFEVDSSGNVLRQVEVYRSGMVLKYDEAKRNDEFGGLAQQPIDLMEFKEFSISKVEFDSRWATS